jgi:hypothetical protein
MKEFFSTTFGCIFAIALFGFGLFQIGAGWAGIQHHWGWWWGLAACVAAVGFRFTLPIVVGCYFYAHDLWSWHWFPSLLFALPGLLFMIPNFIAQMFAGARERY